MEGSAHTQCRHPLYLRIWLYLAKRSDRQGAPVLIWKKTRGRVCLLWTPNLCGHLGKDWVPQGETISSGGSLTLGGRGTKDPNLTLSLWVLWSGT